MAIIVSIEEIKDGMILVEDICNQYGQVLMPNNAEITTKHIEILRKWNIFSIVVKSEVIENSQIPEDLIKQAATIIYGRLEWKPSHQMEKQMLQTCVYKLARELMNNQKEYYD